MSKRLTHFVHV